MSECKIKTLCGFLSPKGMYTECQPWEHMDTATEIVEKEYGQTLSGMKSERLLLEKGYIGLYSRDIGFQWFNNHRLRSLTDEQVMFLIENSQYANNMEQKQAIEELLERNDDVKANHILDLMSSDLK